MKTGSLFMLLCLPVVLFSQGSVGVNISAPMFQMDVRALTSNENTILNIANQDNGYFTRILSGHDGFPASSISWNTGVPFNFGTWDGATFTQIMQLSPQREVGINTFSPQFSLDVRGTDNHGDGADMQLGTPDETNFLRLFGGRQGDKHPFLAFHDADTFHIVSTSADWSTYTRRMTVLPNGDIGIGTEAPGARVHAVAYSSTNVTAIQGYAQTTGGLDIGVSGTAAGEYGYGISGVATHTTGQNYAVHGRTFSGDGYAIYGIAQNSSDGSFGYGVFGISLGEFGRGVSGFANHPSGSTVGVTGRVISPVGKGVRGISEAPSGINYGVYGEADSPDGYGVAGVAKQGVYGLGTGSNAIGVFGRVLNESGEGVVGIGGTGVLGKPIDNEGIGVYGYNDNATLSGAIGVKGKTLATSGAGVRGEAPSGGGRGVDGIGFYGVFGTSSSGIGVIGVSSMTAVRGDYTGVSNGYGVKGNAMSATGFAIHGKNSSSSGQAVGVYGESSSSGGRAIYGKIPASSGTSYAIYGENFSSGGRGVLGYVQAFSGSTIGVSGVVESSSGTGVYGSAPSLEGNTKGVFGTTESSAGVGVYGDASGSSGKALYGYADGIYGKGLHVVATGTHSSVNAILADANNGNAYAGYFIGKVHVSGALSKSSGSFKIDHPLDPENKYLYHSFVESPEMMNVYNGNTVTDGTGFATVELPDYFEALNMDFRYQLTVISGSFAQAVISEEITDNQFRIRTSEPNIKVSWQVTGVRKDPYAQANRIQPEVEKEPENKGRYLNPEVFGQPDANRIGQVKPEQSSSGSH